MRMFLKTFFVFCFLSVFPSLAFAQNASGTAQSGDTAIAPDLSAQVTAGVLSIVPSSGPVETDMWSYTIVNSIATTLVSFAQTVFTDFAKSVGTIVEYVFAIWLIIECVRVFLGVSQFQAFVWNLARKSGLFLLIIGLLLMQGTSAYWDFFVGIPSSFSFGLAQSFMDNSGGVSPICQISSSSSFSNFPEQASCLAANLESIMRLGIMFGIGAITTWPWTGGLGVTMIVMLIPNVILWILDAVGGVIVIMVFVFVLGSLVSKILDFVLRVAVVSAFAPFFIGFALIKPTRRYSISAFKSLVGAFIQMIALGFSLFVCLFMMLGLTNSVASALSSSCPSMSSTTASNVAGFYSFWNQVYQCSNDFGYKMVFVFSPFLGYNVRLLFIAFVTLLVYRACSKVLMEIMGASAFSGFSAVVIPTMQYLGMEAPGIAYNSGKSIAQSGYSKEFRFVDKNGQSRFISMQGIVGGIKQRGRMAMNSTMQNFSKFRKR